jgi:hypothetical protein
MCTYICLFCTFLIKEMYIVKCITLSLFVYEMCLYHFNTTISYAMLNLP